MRPRILLPVVLVAIAAGCAADRPGHASKPSTTTPEPTTTSGPTTTTRPTPPHTGVSLDLVDWAAVTFPMTQCGPGGGYPAPGVAVQPVVLAEPEASVLIAVVVASCQGASNPPTAVFVYDGATSPTSPHLAQTLVTEHDFWIATSRPIATGTTLAVPVAGYVPSDPRSLPSVHTTLTWTWADGTYHETSPEPAHQYSGPG